MEEKETAERNVAPGGAPDALVGDPSPAPGPEHIKEGRRRIVIEAVAPEISGGRFPAKRVPNETVVVEADVFADGHDELACVVRYRGEEGKWAETPMAPVGDDRWRGAFIVTGPGRYRYTIRAWIDRFASWSRDLAKKADGAQDVSVDLLTGADLVDRSADRAKGPERRKLRSFASALRAGAHPDAAKGLSPASRKKALASAVEAALTSELAELMARNSDRRFATAYERELEVVVDAPRSRFSTWYQMFPRSAATQSGRHGTFSDVQARLPYVAEMGFDVLYLPPVHPIGTTHRRGRDNDPNPKPDDPGSPWAIGSEEGGHDAINPELGTFEDFDRLVEQARDEFGIELALDLAFQCSPDHPYVREHPEWFRKRPDGTIQYAENPPKKYEDIFPLDFETEDWRAMWAELRRVVEVWIGHGVRTFRVDNPHTKSFAFWEWLIGEIRAERPDVVFLAEAFTRPKVMYRLAKLGFDQSYTYFAWRTHKHELEDYFTELTRTDVAEYFRPNLWPNTPDILTGQLQIGSRAVFVSRLILAATLGASYGIYGPPFELLEHVAAPGREEYARNEKYEIRHWDLKRADSLAEVIGRVNRIRRENPALHADRTLRFHRIDNANLLTYSKSTDDLSNVILVVLNLDPDHSQSGWTDLYLDDLGVPRSGAFQVHDLLTGARYTWQGSSNFVDLDPGVLPAHVFRVHTKVRTERDFEYYL